MLQIKKRGQSVLEYAILIVIIIAALLTLQSYIKRGIQGRLRSATDDIGDQFTTENGYTFNKTTTTNSKTVEKVLAGATNTETVYSNTVVNATANGLSAAENYWGH